MIQQKPTIHHGGAAFSTSGYRKQTTLTKGFLFSTSAYGEETTLKGGGFLNFGRSGRRTKITLTKCCLFTTSGYPNETMPIADFFSFVRLIQTTLRASGLVHPLHEQNHVNWGFFFSVQYIQLLVQDYSP